MKKSAGRKKLRRLIHNNKMEKAHEIDRKQRRASWGKERKKAKANEMRRKKEGRA